MKSKEGKEKWRQFSLTYEKGDNKIEDYNFGTMLRKSPKTDYGEKEGDLCCPDAVLCHRNCQESRWIERLGLRGCAEGADEVVRQEVLK